MNKRRNAETQQPKLRASEQVELVRVSLDEFNLATFPVSVLDKKAQRSREPLHFHDVIEVAGREVERHWKVFPHQEEGFPGPADDDVLMALFELTREQSGAKKIFFTRYQLCKKLGWPLNTFYYKRIESSFRKLAAVHIEATNAYGDQERKKFINMGFTIIQEYKLFDESVGREKLSYILWSDRMAASISQKLTKYLDASFYFEELETPIEKRLFRYLDNHFDQGCRQLALNIQNLCYEHLGIARRYRYISQLMQKIEGPLQKLVEKGFLLKWRQEGQTLLVFGVERFAARVEISMPLAEMIEDITAAVSKSNDRSASKKIDKAEKIEKIEKIEKAENSDKRSDLAAELQARGVERNVARDIASRAEGRYEREVTDAMRYFDLEQARGKRFDNPAGLLVSLIRKSLPPEEAPPARNRISTENSRPSTVNRFYRASATVYGEAKAPSETILRERDEIAYKEYLDEMGRLAYNNLSQSEQKKMCAAAAAELQSGSHARKYKRMPAEQFAEHLQAFVEAKLSRKCALAFDEWREEHNRQSKKSPHF